ncbi:MAG: amino acid permease [Chloroherpetonaceae bacterium]|nr:amino acid permease [Chloroherpetonaceae bacterium]MDW8436789.1 amino acid permease [Chloroherpetonaceae bacterium]
MLQPVEAASTAPQTRTFKRELGLLSSTMIVIGSMIGSGIFIVSADIARTVGSPGALLMVWLVTGAMTLIAALSYGELAAMMPEAGGQYVYLREAYNPLVAFLYGWTLFLVIQTGTIAAVAVAFAKFAGAFIPALSEKRALFEVGRFKVSAAQILAIASIVFLTAINLRGVKEGKIIQDVFTISKIAALFGLIALGLFVGANETALNANFGEAFWQSAWTKVADGKIVSIEPLSGLGLLAAMGVAMVGSLFSSDAWNNVTFAAGEVVNPKRNVPLSLALGTGAVTLIYLLANVAYLVVLPLRGLPDGADALTRGIQFAELDRVGTAAMSVVLGEAAFYAMAALIMISTFGCNNGLILSGARAYYAMSLDGLFFKKAGELNENGVPAFALIIQGVWASLLCLSGSYGDLLDYVVFAVLLFYVLTIAGVFVLRRSKPDAPRPYKAIGYPVLPILYVVLALAICVDLLVFKPNYTYPGLLIALMGAPVYFLWKRKSKREDGRG